MKQTLDLSNRKSLKKHNKELNAINCCSDTNEPNHLRRFFTPTFCPVMNNTIIITIAFTFVIGSILAGAGGVLYATAYPQIDPVMGYIPGLKAFVAAVFGACRWASVSVSSQFSSKLGAG